ncbi:hypothetical protein, partial [Klebsiella pneumoniae]|uniref:hypothetical protein n=1 Tax=Klebsiella pneumoniae TaxID=573 RepID=UPI00163D525A
RLYLILGGLPSDTNDQIWTVFLLVPEEADEITDTTDSEAADFSPLPDAIADIWLDQRNSGGIGYYREYPWEAYDSIGHLDALIRSAILQENA